MAAVRLPTEGQRLSCGGRAGKPRVAAPHPWLGLLPSPYSMDKPQERRLGLALSWSSTHPAGSRSISRLWGKGLRGPTCEDLSPPCCPPKHHLQPDLLPSLDPQTQLPGTPTHGHLKAKLTPNPTPFCFLYAPSEVPKPEPTPLVFPQPLLSLLITKSYCFSGLGLLLSPPARFWLPGHGLKSHYHGFCSQTSNDFLLSYCHGLHSKLFIAACQAPALRSRQLCQLISACSAGPQHIRTS